ncbi:MAG: hypothetical protein FWD60_01055 [Candidatus Azobacteroides sp.]|nr:hypothetical protein [Candidatus Azobacteroides sp.]
MKIKRSIGVPAALLLYLIAIGIYAWPGHNSNVTYGQWTAVITVTFGCIVVLYFLLRRRERHRNTPKSPKE